MTILSDQKTGVTPELDARTALIASLRTLANLFEDIPDIPPMLTEIGWNIGGTDAEALQTIEAVRAALTREGITHQVVEESGHGIAVEIPLVGKHKARAVHVYDRTMTDYRARTSYESVVQVDADQAEAVA